MRTIDEQQVIKVALITDENYFVPAIVTIKSLLSMTERKVHIKCIVTENFRNDLNKWAEEIADEFPNSQVEFLYFDDSRLKNVKTKWHISRAAYVKIYLPSILSQWDKCIFLDSDLLVNEDIGLLWDTFACNKETKELAAVWNPGYYKDNKYMGLADNEATFNSGIMIMNLHKMRENKATEKLETFIKKYNHLTMLNDQAAFNAVYKKNWTALPLRWNVQFLFFAKSNRAIGIEKNELDQLRNNPAIIHFTTSSKPWKFRSLHPFKKEYLSYFLAIRDANYQDKVTLKDSIKKCREYYLFTMGKL